MVAYSFKRRFVDPIRVGLGIITPVVREAIGDVHPKRHTIRADRRRHARPGEEVQLYCGMRTKSCFLIGRARCIDAQAIRLYFNRPNNRHRRDSVRSGAVGWIISAKQLDDFARSDGFEDWNALCQFWDEEHPGVSEFEGVIIRWEPLP